MPELPEVEQVRRGLERRVVGARLDGCEFRRTDLRWPIPVARVRQLVGHRLERAERIGKYVLLHFDRTAATALLLHLGMSGRIEIGAGPPAEWQRHEHWRLRLGPRSVRYVDPRRFGALLSVDSTEARQHPLLARIGFDPYDPDLDARTLHQLGRKKETTLKSFLLDGRTIAGIGNIYASEACFEAGILPQARVSRLSLAAWRSILGSIRAVLDRAIAAGGTSLRDYRTPDGHPGGHQNQLRVYGRAGQACPRCGGAIRSRRDAGRSTYYCSTCQRRKPRNISG